MGEEEVRRFVIDKNVSTSYDYLVEKLKTMFPQLQGAVISLSWTDSDGDNVTIASDDELIIALTEMTGPLYKINVSVKVPASVPHVDIDDQMAGDGEHGVHVHYGVTCDGCDKKPITGNRYKCVVCDDYDLCETCETAGKHPGHNKMKIIEPGYIFPQRLFKRMQVLQNRASKKMRKEEREDEEAPRGQHPRHPPPCRGMGHRGRGMFGGPRFGGRGGLMGFGGPLNAMMQGWTGGVPVSVYTTEAANKATEDAQRAANQATADANKAAADAHKAAHETAHAAAQAAATAGLGGLAAMNQAFQQMHMAGSDEYLKNIGDMVAAYLDPMGIDVKIDIESPDGSRTNVSTSTKTTTETSTEENAADKKEEEEKKDEAAANDEVMEVEPEPAKKSATPSDDDEDWTVVSDKKEVEEKQAAALYPDLTAAAAGQSEVTAAAGQAGVTASAPAEPAAATHPDPRIQVALQAMMNMGFTN